MPARHAIRSIQQHIWTEFFSGVVGRKAGAEAGYNYSEAMKNAGLTWTPEQLFSYLADPKKIVPGNKMPYAGMKSADDRKNLIAFLREHPKPS